MSEGLSNVFEGHVLPRRNEGDVNIINITLFNPDGSPFELPTVPDPLVLDDWYSVTNAELLNGAFRLDDSIPPQYRKRTDDIVEFRGMMDPPAIGNTAFVVPEAYRHDYNGDLIFLCPAYDGNIAHMLVKNTGEIQLYKITPNTVQANDLVWINLTGIRYSV